ncbi:MAG: PfkB family carbohydrate kinase [candidate division Zixibacteria bacterium]
MRRSSRKATVDCLGLGIIPLDILLEVPRLPDVGGKIDATNALLQGGGPVPNCLTGLSRLGFKTTMIAAVGDDLFGEMTIRELTKERVSTKYMITKGTASDLAAGYVESGSGRRTIVLRRSAYVRPVDLKVSRLPVPRLIHMDGRDLDACMKLARYGRKVGAVISFDIGSMRNDVSPIFPLVDHLVVADAYALPFTGCRNAKAAARKLSQLCPGTIVVTEGLEGQLALEDGKFSRQSAFPVDPVDTTGAGDAFHAGYLYGLLQGKPLEERMEIGSAVAALKCLKMGARTSLPTMTELKRFLKKIRKPNA